MASGNFKFSLHEVRIIKHKWFGGTDVESVSNIVHGAIMVSIEGIVACDSFLNR